MKDRKETTFILSIYFLLFMPIVFFVISSALEKGGEAGIFREVFLSGGKYRLFLSSVLTSGIISLFNVLTGVAVSVFIRQMKGRASHYLRFLFFLPLIVPSFTYVETLMGLSEATGWNFLNQTSYIILSALIYFPLAMIIINCGLESVGGSLIDAGRLLSHGNRWFVHIVLPYLRPYLISSFILCFLFSFNNYELPSLIGARTYTIYVFDQFSAFYDYKKAVYLLLPVFILFLGLVIAHILVIGNRVFFSLDFRNDRERLKFSGTGKFFMLMFLFLLSLPVISPVFILIYRAAKMHSFRELFAPYYSEILYSLMMTALGGLTAVLFAAFYVKLMVYSRRLKFLLFLLSVLPFAVPPALIAISLIGFFNRYSPHLIYGTSALIVLSFCLRFLPIVIQMIYSRSVSLSPRLMEAGRMLSPSYWKGVLRIWIPLNKNVLKSALFLFILLALGEVGMSVLLSPPDKMLASVNIYGMLHYGLGKEVAAETLLVLTVILMLGAVIFRKNREER